MLIKYYNFISFAIQRNPGYILYIAITSQVKNPMVITFDHMVYKQNKLFIF